jgi:hypothetical protein
MGLTSQIVDVGEPQADGRRYVKEVHTTDEGRVFPYEYLAGPELDPELVLIERAALITETLACRAAARAAVVGTEVPWTKFEYLERFTAAERVAIRRRAKTDPFVEDYLELMNASGGVYPKLARPGLTYLAQLGDLTPERAAIIGANE